MEYVLWTIAVLAGLYLVVRLVLAAFFKQDKYRG